VEILQAVTVNSGNGESGVDVDRIRIDPRAERRAPAAARRAIDRTRISIPIISS